MAMGQDLLIILPYVLGMAINDRYQILVDVSHWIPGVLIQAIVF